MGLNETLVGFVVIVVVVVVMMMMVMTMLFASFTVELVFGDRPVPCHHSEQVMWNCLDLNLGISSEHKMYQE